jgi:hypothetical protein
MPTAELVADALTKPLPKVPFLDKRKLMNLREKREDPKKRKSLMSKVVVPKKFNLNLFGTLLMILQFLCLGLGDKFEEGSPVLWRKTTEPPVVGFSSVNIKVNLISLCTLLPTDGLTNAAALKLQRKCEDQYESLFMDELEAMCPSKHPSLKRHRRFVFTAIGLIAIFVIASAGVGMASYAIHEIDNVKVTQAEVERTLDDLERKATVNSQNLFTLQEEVKAMGQTINKLIMDVNNFKEKAIEVQYIVSYLVSRLLIGTGVIPHTKKLWRKKEMDDSFFEFLDFTLPCGEKGPVALGEPRACSLDLDENTLNMEFTVPMINKNLTIVNADPFFLMVKENNQTCKIVYHGPENALISADEDCVHAVDMGKETRGRILFPHSQKCQKHDFLSDEKHWFGIRSCNPSKEGTR